jgi:glycosyltransferase involved in cell wall biosynthesis
MSRILHQVIIGAVRGDAICEQALLYRRWLRELGYVSEVFAEHVDPSIKAEVRPFVDYHPTPAETHVIYHHSIGSPIAEALLRQPLELILVYHNITPAHFFAGIHPPLARQMQWGRDQLPGLLARTDIAMADSTYNARELQTLSFPEERIGVVPLPLDERFAIAPDAALLRELTSYGGPTLLFVGRLAPNKRPDDLIKLLYYYRRIQPAARLILAGPHWVGEYAAWLKEFVRDLNLREAVTFTGYLPQQAALMAYYRSASVYVSMSEHEGFGRPLVESMYLGVPVLAYAAAAVPDTLGGAGVLFHHKHYEALVEVVHLLVTDVRLRQRTIEQQRERAGHFLCANVKRLLEETLARTRLDG